MAIKTREEILSRFNEMLGDNTDDATLEFIGDLTDTLGSVDERNRRISELEAENQRIDNDWRKKYRERFFAPVDDDDEEDDPNPPALKTKYDELFTVKKG